MITARIPIALQQATINVLRHYLALANQRLNKIYPEPYIRYQQRGTIAGTAWLQQWEICLNPVLLLENGQHFINEVIPHELAHLLVYKKFDRVAPHGHEWRWMMIEILGASPHRTHRFLVTSVRSKTYPYHCACQQHQLTIRRHNRVIRGKAKYHCRQCGELLSLSPIMPLSNPTQR